ncbi:MAG: hypothetical protein HOW73_34420 [Polyangiaceae bacterium]|nr:hypothetical protein [Polyangiaceae bacterium]
MNRDVQSLHFVCTDCGRRAPAPGDCPCGAGPFVDLSKPEFRDMVIEIDDRRAESHQQRVLWAGVGAGIIGGVFVLAVAHPLIAAIPLPVPFAMPIKVIAMMIGLTLLTSRVLGEIWKAPRRFPELVASRPVVVLPSRLRAPKKATLIGIGAFLALGIAINVAAPFVKEWSNREEREHREEVAKRVEKLHGCVVENRPVSYGLSTRDVEWTAECKKPLARLYESLDGRSDDRPLRSVLDGLFSCNSGCKAGALDEHYRELFNAAIHDGIPLESYEGRDSIVSPRRSTFTSSSW